jgi:hypothetical protein
MRLRLWMSSLTAVVLLGCAAPAAAVGTAAMTTAVAVSAAAISRSQGGCIAACPDGTQCNGKTGLCDVIPCRGRCATNERCEQTSVLDKCVPAAEVDLQIERAPEVPARTTPK